MIKFISGNITPESFKENALSLIVSYCDCKSLEKSLYSYRLTFQDDNIWPLLIIDNGSSGDIYSFIKRTSIVFPYRWIQLNSNIGVAAAYNLGLKIADELGVKWLLILDQDSYCSPGLPNILYQMGIKLFSNGVKVGAVVPTVRSNEYPDMVHLPYRWSGSDFVHVQLEDCNLYDYNNKLLQIDSTITSGTLYNTQALKEIEGFKENFFIDFVDHECHLRMRSAGWKLWWVPWAELSHKLGSWQKSNKNGIWIQHEPYRYYYMARNMIAMYWKFGRIKGLYNASRQIYRHCGLLRKHSYYSNKCIAYILKGIIDAIKGKFGQLDAKN